MCGLLLGVVSPFGTEVNGAQAWFQLGPFQLQPSEFSKIAVIIALASLGAHFGNDLDVRRLGVLLAVPGIPLVLIMLQPDPGTAMVFVAITMGMLVAAGVRAKHLAALTLLGLTAVVGLLSSGFLEDYQTDRLTVFLNPNAGLQAEAYNLNQSKIAIGSGGITGKGFGEGSQSHLNYLPEPHTDFVFATMAEEWGLLGGLLVLLVFGIVLRWGLTVARRAPDRFSQLLAGGMTATIFFYVAINLLMVMGLAPVVGIPLPFMSHGGSSMMTNMICLGTLMMVDRWSRRAGRTGTLS